MDWMFSKTSDEDILHGKAFEFEDKYFSDMTLKDYEKELTAHEVLVNGEWVKCIGDYCNPGDLSIDGWRFVIVKNPKGYAGKCFPNTQEIRIAESHKRDDYVLLHEMIHAYESMLSDIRYEQYKHFLIIELYEKLSPSIPDLKKLIIRDIHTLDHVHNPLFFLKSIDLDSRLKEPLGTIYGYGRKELFKEVKNGRSDYKAR